MTSTHCWSLHTFHLHIIDDSTHSQLLWHLNYATLLVRVMQTWQYTGITCCWVWHENLWVHVQCPVCSCMMLSKGREQLKELVCYHEICYSHHNIASCQPNNKNSLVYWWKLANGPNIHVSTFRTHLRLSTSVFAMASSNSGMRQLVEQGFSLANFYWKMSRLSSHPCIPVIQHQAVSRQYMG